MRICLRCKAKHRRGSQGQVRKVAGSDLVLDAPERLNENKTPNQQMLVHDFQDGLTINFIGDYPGGVTITGNAAMTGDLLRAGTALCTTLEFIQFSLRSLQGTVAGTSDRVHRLETAVASLVELIGASVILPRTLRLKWNKAATSKRFVAHRKCDLRTLSG
jgi:hypothetical protein